MIELLLRPRQGLEADPTYPLMVPGEASHHDWQALGRIKAEFDEAVLAAATARSPLLPSSSSSSSTLSSSSFQQQQQQQQHASLGGQGLGQGLTQGLGQGAVAPPALSPRRQRFQYCRAEDR